MSQADSPPVGTQDNPARHIGDLQGHIRNRHRPQNRQRGIFGGRHSRTVLFHQHGTPRRGQLRSGLTQISSHYVMQFFRGGQNLFQLGNRLAQLVSFRLQFQPGKLG